MSDVEKLERLEVLFHLWKVIRELDCEIGFNGISQHEGSRDGIWFRISLPGHRQALIAPVTPLLISRTSEQSSVRLIPQSVVCIREFLEMFYRPNIATIKIVDFGYYTPSASASIFSVHSNASNTDHKLQFLITEISDPEEESSELATEFILDQLEDTKHPLDAWIPLSKNIPSDGSPVSNRVHVRTHQNSVTSLWSGALTADETSCTLFLEERIDMKQTPLIPARIVIRDIELQVCDYLSLTAGDEIRIPNKKQIPVLLEIGGVAVAEGSLDVEEEGLCFQVHSPTTGNKFNLFTNRIRDNLKQGEIEHDNQDSSINTELFDQQQFGDGANATRTSE